MYLIPIAWMYVAIMMAVAEATSPQGSILGAFFTLLLYGVLPLAVLMYILRTPGRRRARRAREQQQADAAAQQQPATIPSRLDPDGGGHAAGAAVPPEREKP